MDVDDGSRLMRALRSFSPGISGPSLDYDGNVTVRLVSGHGEVVTIAGHRTMMRSTGLTTFTAS